MLPLMFPELKLTGFSESIDGEQGLVMEIQWKDVRPLFDYNTSHVVPLGEDATIYSSLQRIPYDSLSGSLPSQLDISRSFSAAGFSTQCSLYLAPKVASFVQDIASSSSDSSPPSFFVMAELKTLDMYHGLSNPPMFYAPEQLIPRRQDPSHQPRGSPSRSRLFYHDRLISDSIEARGTEGVSALAISKLKESELAREDEEGGDCSVCLDEMSDVEELLTMPCDHTFHERCILAWLENKNSCPLCRCQIQDD